MGHKKRAPKLETPSPTKTLAVASKVAVVVPAANIKTECERALTALRRGNHQKALRLMKEVTPKFENSALFHRVAGTIYVKVAGIIDDPNVKSRHLKNAVESARKAKELSPNSVEYAHFYANLLLEVSNESKEYEEVISECERALAVENPNDPALDELSGVEKDDTVSLSEEAKDIRVSQVKSEIRGVIQRANIASISSWMKNLGGGIGEEKFRIIPVGRRAAGDPVEVKYLSGNGNGNGGGRRGNEIKKAVKTVEERRKEIEVRVAAARLLQQKNETVGEESKVSNVSVSGPGGGGSSGGGGFRGGGEKRRSGGSRRIGSISERKDQVRSFWNTMSFEMKRDLLIISVSDLRAYLDRLSSKDGGQAGKAFTEAVAFGDANQTWKFWACCCCGERFADASAHIQHVIQEHTGNLLPKLRDVLPVSVDNEWEEMLISCSWEPLDLTASVRMLEDECKVEASEYLGRETLKVQADDCGNDNARSEDTWESFHDNKNEENSCNSNILENGGDDGISNIECKTCDKKVDCKMYNQNNSWPLSDDTDRAKLLKKISSSFQALLRQKCLTVTHLQKVIHYTMEELEGLFPGSQILSCGVDQTPLCICFLEASPLKKIADFLQNISYFGRYPERVSVDYTGPHPQVLDCEDRITLDESASSLQLDKSLLPFNGVKDDVGSGNSVDGFGKISQPDSDPLLSWIYAGSSGTEQLATWSRIREERCQEGMQLLETLGKEFNQLRTLCEKKHELLGYEEALQGLEKLLLEESNKKEQVTDISYRSYESILQKRRDELVEVDNEALFVSNRLELDIISTVMKEAESLHVSQYGYEDTYGGVASHHCDLESGEEEWRSKDYIQRMDNCTKVILQRQKEHVDTELSKLDAQIMYKLVNMNQLEVKLETVSVLDYRFILLPLMTSFMRAHLEDLAEKDATEKSDAAREAFLAELALDSKKCSGSGNDTGKSTHEKMKDRKRNKELRRIKDSKLGGYNDQLETADQLSLVGSDILESESSDTIRELDDEFQRKLEIEAEERKLEETLEYQRRLENEAKQRLLVEQRRRTDLIAFDGALDHSGDVQLGISEAPHCKQVAFPCKSDGADSVTSSQRNLRDDTNLRIADDVGSANSHLNTALSNVGNPSDGALPFEHQAGRRGKRRNSIKVPEGKYQTMSHGKENAKLENSTTNDVVQKELPWNSNSALNQTVVDGGSKTLRQLQAEEDEEERFQADLKKAVMQSLDTFQARQKIPVALKSGNGYSRSEDFANFGTKVDGVICDTVNETDLVGRGLQNEIGEYNCFLNVIIQSLWHLRRFREEFLRRSTSEHVHVGDPCVVCALFDILTALSVSSGDANAKPVIPSMLRIALSNLYPENNFFQEGQMNDASEVLGVIFECLHQSFTSGPGGSDSDSAESNGRGSWDCSSPDCVAHTLFGMDIFERMNCYNCGLESRHLKYTSFFHNINVSALRTMKVMYAESSFVELLNSVEMNHQLACDPEVDGCGKLSHIHHILSNPPHVFTAVLGWQNTCESLDDIKATLEALSTEIDMSVLYRGLDLQILHRLVSVVCYYGQHYHCFAYSHDHEKWIMYDDKTVKVIGTWKDVLSMCERGHLQPQVLFYEAVN